MNTTPKSNERSQKRPSQGVLHGALAMLLLLPIAGWAGGLVTNCTETALRSAMAGGGTVTFACDGTITLASTIYDNVDLMLDGTGHHVTIGGNNAVGLIYVATNANLTVINLSFANGLSTNGGALFNAGTVSATNCSFTGNCAAGPGGREYGTDGAIGAGGAVYNAGTLVASQCAFVLNSAAGGLGRDGNPVVQQPSRAGQGASGLGGALCNVGAATIERSLFASNSAFGGSGGRGSDGAYYYYSTEATPGGRGGSGDGGAVWSGTTITLVNCTIVGNSAVGGSGGDGGSQTGPWPGVRFGPPGGYAGDGTGGGCSGPLIMTNCTVTSNSARGGHGGAGGGSSLYAGPGRAGGIAVGGLYGSCPLLINSIVAANSGTGGSGGYGCWDSHIPPITCANWPSGVVYTNLYGSAVDLGHNLRSDWGFTNATSLNNTDPKLGDLANNGGPTLTMALLPGSPAIDAGDTAAAPATDQRGISRPVGPAADIGAFEYGLPAVLRVTGSAGTGLDIYASAYPGLSCRLLVSSNFASWFVIATNQIGSDGTSLFHDNCAPGGACRFYRVAMP